MLSTEKNRLHYTALYDSLEMEPLLQKAQNLDFFHEAIEKHTSWFGMYQENFASRLPGRRVLELGAGDGLNALIMARLGAQVTAIEIAPPAVAMLQDASRALGLRVEAICGDFLEMWFAPFDFIVGKAFLHHLDHETEEQFLRKCARLLKSDGEARFQEPAVNSHALDTLRWIVPAPGRPSILNRRAFAGWKAEDPHPERDQSSRHYEQVGRKYFGDVRIVPFGGVERFRRLIRDRHRADEFARWALRAERRYMPMGFRNAIARSQTIIYSSPIL
jgi:SAM-dependent methyltransferase